MPATVHRRDWTLEEFFEARDAAPQGERWEFVDGEVLVTPSPNWNHQGIVSELLVALASYVREHRLGRIFTAPLDVTLDPRLILQPDLLVVPPGALKGKEDPIRRLLLAIEVISPGSARHDRVTKRPHYQRKRVPDYWIFDGESRTVERWGPDDARPQIIADELRWQPAGAPEPFVLALEPFFAAALLADD